MPTAGFAIALAIQDVVDAHRSALRTNKRMYEDAFGAVPTALSDGEVTVPGIAVFGRF